MSLGSIVVRLTMNTADFDTDTKRAAKIADKRAKEIDASFRKAGAAIGAALAAGLGIATALVGQAINRMDELSKAAQKVGMPTEELSALGYAADLADVELGQLTAGLAKLTKFQSDAAMGTEKNVALFDALGISFRNTDGTLRKTSDVFRDFAQVFATLPDGASKTALALDVFGRSGANLIPLLNGGAKGLDDMAQRAAELGLVVSQEAGRAAEEFNDRLSDLRLMVGGLAGSVATELLPDLNRLVGEFQNGTETGEGFAGTAENIANALRGVAWFAGKTFDALNLVVMGIANVMAKAGQFGASLPFIGDGAAAAMFGDIAAVTGDRAGDAARSLAGTDEGAGPGFTRRMSRKEEAKDTGELTGALNEYYASRKNAAAADGAAAEAARAAAEAQRELERVLEAGNEARAGLSETIAANAAEMAGPAAVAAKAYADELVRLVGEEEKLRAAKLLTADTERELAIARDQANAAYQEQLADIEKERTAAFDGLMADLEFELNLIGMTNLEREKAIALRYANADAASAEGKAITAMLDEIDKKAQQQEGIDFLKGEMKGLLVDLTDGVGSLSDAWDNFFDNLTARVMQMLADRLIEQLFDAMSSTSSNKDGNGWMSIIGSLFSGARAGGGDVKAGHAYTVGENGKELFVPTTAGSIVPAGPTAAMGRGSLRGGDIYNFHGSTSRRALERLEIDKSRRQRRETARTA